MGDWYVKSARYDYRGTTLANSKEFEGRGSYVPSAKRSVISRQFPDKLGFHECDVIFPEVSNRGSNFKNKHGLWKWKIYTHLLSFDRNTAYLSLAEDFNGCKMRTKEDNYFDRTK